MLLAGLLALLAGKGINSFSRIYADEVAKERSHYIDEKGRETWFDSEGSKYINGERVLSNFDYIKKKLIEYGEKTGTIYYDSEQAGREYWDKENERMKQVAIKGGRLSYLKYSYEWKQNITTEVATDRPIAILGRYKDDSYFYTLCPR